MPILSFGTLAAATARARNRPSRTIALVMGLEGARYYVFFSQPNLGQYLNRIATEKVNLGAEIAHYAEISGLGNCQNLTPTVVAAAVRAAGRLPINMDHNIRRNNAEKLTNRYLIGEAKARGIVQMAGHAETFLISSWRECLGDFLNHRGHAPRQGEIFLTNTPCRDCDANPSSAMLIDGVEYPRSCRAKLYTFFKKNSSVRWKIWYAERFGTAEALSDEELIKDFPGLAIGRMPDYFLPMFKRAG